MNYPLITLALLLNVVACSSDEGFACALDGSEGVSGTVYDKNGDPVLPDRVILITHDTAEECSLIGPRPFGFPDAAPPMMGGFSCRLVGHHPAQVQVYVGQEIVTTDVEFRSDRCGIAAQRVDVHL